MSRTRIEYEEDSNSAVGCQEQQDTPVDSDEENKKPNSRHAASQDQDLKGGSQDSGEGSDKHSMDDSQTHHYDYPLTTKELDPLSEVIADSIRSVGSTIYY